MKAILTVGFFLFFVQVLRAQDVVQWKFNAKKLSASRYELHLKATITRPYHIYSVNSPAGGGLPTHIIFNKHPLVILHGPVKESANVTSKFEDVFGVTVQYFDGHAEFIQVVDLKRPVATTVTGSVEWMSCNDTQCLPPKTLHFSIPLK